MEDFLELLNPTIGKQRILSKLRPFEEKPDGYLRPWLDQSKPAPQVYPSQGLLTTPFDGLDIAGFQFFPQDQLIDVLRIRFFFLEVSNHPNRIASLDLTNKTPFLPPPKIACPTLETSTARGLSLSIRDISARVTGSQNNRVSRTERYAQGVFIKLGKHARIPFVGSANPDVWGSSLAIATMAASHALTGIPRNGLLSDVRRQADLAKETIQLLNDLSSVLLSRRSDRKKIINYWVSNLMGILESNPEKALTRAEALLKAGVTAFRVYSPEPGSSPITTTRRLRKEFGDKIEIFTGQIVDVVQAQKTHEAGADAVYVGIGGGGRCTTGVRSGSVIDWPELVWNLRGAIQVPIIVEGGASDHIATTFLLGASGIGVSRAAAGGTIESPGATLYCVDKSGRLFKPYGGEASARNKISEKKILPFDIPLFVEGETNQAFLSFLGNGTSLPTLTYHLHQLLEDAILAMVFRGVSSIPQLHSLNPSPLCRITSLGQLQVSTH